LCIKKIAKKKQRHTEIQTQGKIQRGKKGTYKGLLKKKLPSQRKAKWSEGGEGIEGGDHPAYCQAPQKSSATSRMKKKLRLGRGKRESNGNVN